MKNKIGLLVVCLFVMGILTSCVQGDYKLTVNKDGSGKSTVKIGVDEESADSFGSRGERLIEAAKDGLQENGYVVKPYTENGYAGYIAEKSFEDIQKMDALPAAGGLTEAGMNAVLSDIPIDVTTEEGFFTDTYKVDAEVDLEQSGLLGGMQQLVSDKVDVTFTLDLPISPKNHNADKVDGNVLQWNIKPAGKTKMMVEVAAPNIRNIVWTIAAVLGVAAILFVIRRRKKQSS
ncbi:LppM family (lipo)protein [Halobacillus litoralis]|uniref:LppM family (lipo)protein n=1 Tax=Halobacillus litoralis TaxID=45668 RepID=UPI001CFF3292|nr:hypothetical protein [Halobacillus litoralis]